MEFKAHYKVRLYKNPIAVEKRKFSDKRLLKLYGHNGSSVTQKSTCIVELICELPKNLAVLFYTNNRDITVDCLKRACNLAFARIINDRSTCYIFLSSRTISPLKLHILYNLVQNETQPDDVEFKIIYTELLKELARQLTIQGINTVHDHRSFTIEGVSEYVSKLLSRSHKALQLIREDQ